MLIPIMEEIQDMVKFKKTKDRRAIKLLGCPIAKEED
jgi:hypothetical protein